MRVGDKITWTPEAFEQIVSNQHAERRRMLRSVTGRVAYIHPKGRYYMAEAIVEGSTIRECFPIKRK